MHFVSRLTKNTDLQNKNVLSDTLSADLLGILVGLVLGDATLYKTKSGKTSVKFEYSYKHEDYIMHLHGLLKKWTVSDSPSVYLAAKGERRGMPDTTRQYCRPHSYFFYTYSTPCLNVLWDLFMEKGKKSIHKDLINYLTPTGLAYWILDDGSLSKAKGFMTLHTEGFTHKEVCLLSEMLNKKFQLSTKPMEKKNYRNKEASSYWILYIPKASVEILMALPDFCETISNIPSLAHKLPKQTVSFF